MNVKAQNEYHNDSTKFKEFGKIRKVPRRAPVIKYILNKIA